MMSLRMWRRDMLRMRMKRVRDRMRILQYRRSFHLGCRIELTQVKSCHLTSLIKNLLKRNCNLHLTTNRLSTHSVRSMRVVVQSKPPLPIRLMKVISVIHLSKMSNILMSKLPQVQVHNHINSHMTMDRTMKKCHTNISKQIHKAKHQWDISDSQVHQLEMSQVKNHLGGTVHNQSYLHVLSPIKI